MRTKKGRKVTAKNWLLNLWGDEMVRQREYISTLAGATDQMLGTTVKIPTVKLKGLSDYANKTL